MSHASEINLWTRQSIELANQRNYLDLMFRVYPVNVNLQRELPEDTIIKLKHLYMERDNQALLRLLLNQEIFPVKDSYVAYLKRDPGALERNPATCSRLAGMLYDMRISEIIARTTMPNVILHN